MTKFREYVGGFLVLLLIVGVMVFAGAVFSEEYAPADLNRDGEVNTIDWSIFNAQYPYGN